MKEYQNAGLAGKDSKIIFNDVEVPAGYYESSEESFKLYESLVNGDLDEMIDNLIAADRAEKLKGEN